MIVCNTRMTLVPSTSLCSLYFLCFLLCFALTNPACPVVRSCYMQMLCLSCVVHVPIAVILHTFTYTCVHTCIQMCTYMYSHTHVQICIHIHMYSYVFTIHAWPCCARYFATLPALSSTNTPPFQQPVASPMALFSARSLSTAALWGTRVCCHVHVCMCCHVQMYVLQMNRNVQCTKQQKNRNTPIAHSIFQHPNTHAPITLPSHITGQTLTPQQPSGFDTQCCFIPLW